jgi:hypothetical protein
MDYTTTSAPALAVTVGVLCYKWYKHWRSHKTLAERFVCTATQVQSTVDTVSDSQKDQLDTKLKDPECSSKTKTRHHGVFRNYLVASGQAKFGVPKRNEANRLTVRKYLYDLCKEHGLLARHIVEHLDIATELVFIPTRPQLIAAAVRSTDKSMERLEVYRQLVGSTSDVA